MKDFLKRILGFGLPKDSLVAPQGTILTLGEDRKGVLHGTTRSANVLISGGTSRDRIEKIIIPTLLRGTSATYVVDDPTGDVFAVTAAARAKLGPVSRIQWGVGRWDTQCRYNPIADENLGDNPDARSRRLRCVAEAIMSEAAALDDVAPVDDGEHAGAEIRTQSISALWGILELACNQVQSFGVLPLIEPTLHGISNTLLRSSLSTSLNDYLRAAEASDSGRALFEFRALADLPDSRRTAVADLVTSCMKAFNPEKIAWLTGESRSNWDVHQRFVPFGAVPPDGPVTLYVNCPRQYGEGATGLNILTQILWRHVIDEALHVEDRRDKPISRRHEAFLFTGSDQMSPIPGIAELATQPDGSGLSVLVSSDDAPSLDRLYGVQEAQALRTTFDIEIDCAQGATQFVRIGPEKPVLRPLNGMSSFLLPAPKDYFHVRA